MAENKTDMSLVNLGDLSKPATVLVERISDLFGGIFRPAQTRRVAHAEADAKKIMAAAEIEVGEMRIRALQRLLQEEEVKQGNIESVITKALPAVLDTAKPENIKKDWLVDFFEKVRLVSDEEMQLLWSKILSGEANNPGSFSKRTLELVSVLGQDEATIFELLGSFAWTVNGDYFPLVYGFREQIYSQNGLTFVGFNTLEVAGLVKFIPLGNYTLEDLPQNVNAIYFDKKFNITFPNIKNDFEIGKVVYTKSGHELAKICQAKSLKEFEEYVIKKWTSDGWLVKLQ